MNVLDEAAKLVSQERQDAYGHPAAAFGLTASVWSVILGCPVSAEQIGLCMIALKLVRKSHRHKPDNLVDIAGYAQTVAMIHEEGGS